jgi:hypothetical protein
MLCSRHKPLNASVTADCLPDAHHEHPSRAAGSFSGRTLPSSASPEGSHLRPLARLERTSTCHASYRSYGPSDSGG